MAIGDLLKELLEKKGLTVAALARLSGVNSSTLYSYLRRNTQKIDPAVLRKIADALSVDVQYFFGEEIENPKKEGVEEPEGDELDTYNELWQLREELRRNPEMRTLFSLTRNATPDQLRQTIEIIKVLKKDSENQ